MKMHVLSKIAGRIESCPKDHGFEKIWAMLQNNSKWKASVWRTQSKELSQFNGRGLHLRVLQTSCCNGLTWAQMSWLKTSPGKRRKGQSSAMGNVRPRSQQHTSRWGYLLVLITLGCIQPTKQKPRNWMGWQSGRRNAQMNCSIAVTSRYGSTRQAKM